MWWLLKRPDDSWKYQAKREVGEGKRLWSLVFWGLLQEADGELKLNWFTHKNWIQSTKQNVKCKQRITKPVNTIIIQKSSDGFHSKGLSVSDFSFFTSAIEQKWRTREGSVSLCILLIAWKTWYFQKSMKQRCLQDTEEELPGLNTCIQRFTLLGGHSFPHFCFMFPAVLRCAGLPFQQMKY